jgi:phage N-6-adenine-methyltransferase
VGDVSLVNFRAKNHPQQVNANGAREDTDDRRTPDALWLPLDNEFGFTLDAAATADNTKCPKWCEDGLTEAWRGRVWCNPPYSNLGAWVRKAWKEAAYCEVIVMLLPANRTEQAWWQDEVEPVRDQEGGDLRVRFLRGRQRFDRPGWTKPAKGDRPPFGLCLLIWQRSA